MCKELTDIATSENMEPTIICHETAKGDRVWITAEDLDWLCDVIEDPVALRVRQAFRYNRDFQGAYYYYDF